MKPVTDVRINQMYFKVLPCKSRDGDYWDTVNKGKWESETFDFMRNYIRPDKDYFELGAWIGSTILGAYAFNPRKIYGIEADPANFQTLKYNVNKNYLQDKVQIFNTCVTDTGNAGKIVGFGTANKEKPNSSSHRLDNGSRVKVKTESILPFLHKNTDIRNINTINMDIEGSECYMGELFSFFQDKDVAILLSLHPPFWTKEKDKIIANLLDSIQKYTILCPFTYNEIKKPDMKDKILENKFFSIIMQGRSR